MRRLRRVLVTLVVLVALILGAATGYVVYTTRRMLPQISGAIALPGLDGEVKIYRDSSGIPQIYASTPRDLFYAQGLVHAQDRWWEMEFNRHVGLGRISELVGKNAAALKNDIFIRTVGWNRAAEANLKAASPESLDVLNSYSSGINAYLEGKSGPDLAVEYSLLAIKGVNIPIEKWQPLHSIAWTTVMSWNLGDNLGSELNVAELYRTLGNQLAESVVPNYYYPPYPEKFPTILTKDDLPVKAEPVTGTQSDQVRFVGPGVDLTRVQTHLIGEPPKLLPLFGSNNWVVSGSLTASGKPLLANDPHLGIQMPSIWYENGLHCITVSPDCPYDVVGYSFPGLPGIVIGHNANIAWGVTNATVDTQDAYIIKVDPTNDTRYIVDGKTLDMQVITERITFGDNTPPQDVRVRITRFGPIITDSELYSDDMPDRSSPLALHMAALSEPGDVLSAALGIDKASDWQSFRAALTKWSWPAQNFVYADVKGNIGYQLPGLQPIRANGHSGITPIDGSTAKYDWKGFVPFGNLPRIYNPARGYIVTANNATVPPEYYQQLADAIGGKYGADSNYVFNRMFDYGYRADRIVTMITATQKHNIDSFKAIQQDNYDGGAAQLLPPALALDYGSDVPKDVIDWLKGWDYQTGMDSGQAALYASYWVQLSKRVWSARTRYTPDGTAVVWGMARLLDDPKNVLWDDITTKDKTETRDDALKSALTAAYKDTVARLGADYKSWKWGTAHTAKFVSNPLGTSGIGPVESLVNAGPVAVSGSSLTVNRTGWSAGSGNFSVTSISSMRMIVDLSNFNASQWIQSTGQSGHPTSVYARDMIDKWRLGQYDTMYWGRDAIEKAAVNTLTLQKK